MSERVTGTVKFFNEDRGYGFIKRDDGDTEVFLHITALTAAKLSDIGEGDKLSFEIEKTGKGLRAVNVKQVAG